jgi:hypothetical protein
MVLASPIIGSLKAAPVLASRTQLLDFNNFTANDTGSIFTIVTKAESRLRL